MVGVSVADVAALGKRRNDDERNARPVTEEVQRLNVTGVVVTAALVKGDDESCAGEKLRVGLKQVHDFPGHALKEIELRGSWVTVQQAVRFDERYGRKGGRLDGSIKIGCVFDMGCALCR